MPQQRKQKPAARFNSITTGMMLYFVLLICIVILLVSTISYVYSIRDFETLSIRYTESLIAEINAGVDSYMDNIKSMSSVICENGDVQALMALYNDAGGAPLSGKAAREAGELRGNVMRHLSLVAKTRSEITNVAVISAYRDVVLSDSRRQSNPYSEYAAADWYQKPLTYKENIVVSPSHVQNLVSGEYTWVISISRAVLDPVTGAVAGVMVIDLNFNAIKAICENVQMGKNGYTYIIDDDGNIIYHPQQQLIYSGIKAEPLPELLQQGGAYLRTGENKIYTLNRSGLTGWTAVGVVNANELIRDRTRIIDFYFTLSAVSLVFAALTALAISASITRPLKRLEAKMRLVEEGDLSIRADTGINNEIGHLGKAFNAMIAKLKYLMDTAVATEEAKRKSEINALQAQINPHFLYNTLDSIIWMSASGKNEQVTEMTAALANLFRTSISRGENYVPLRNEMENIQSYLTIQKMRYGDILSYELEVDERFLSAPVPKLILQPIVENALYHGIKCSETGGIIHIGARQEGNVLILTVRDNGVGMTPEQLAHIFDTDKDSPRGIGVLNVHNRIQLCFGPAYGLRYSGRPGGGTCVEIRLPAQGCGEEEDYE